MPDESLPPSIGATPLPPPSLSPQQEELCERLDEWHKLSGLKIRPSKMFEGAIFAITLECQSNPDRIAQAAHSLREILYPFWSPQVKNVSDKKEKAFIEFGSALVDDAIMQEAGRVYGQLTNLAHHSGTSTNPDFLDFTISDFERLLADFERVLRESLKRQTDLHNQFDQILSAGPNEFILDNPAA